MQPFHRFLCSSSFFSLLAQRMRSSIQDFFFPCPPPCLRLSAGLRVCVCLCVCSLLPRWLVHFSHVFISFLVQMYHVSVTVSQSLCASHIFLFHFILVYSWFFLVARVPELTRSDEAVIKFSVSFSVFFFHLPYRQKFNSTLSYHHTSSHQ